MNNTPTVPTSVVGTLIQQIAAYYPEPHRSEIEAAIPTITLEAVQLAAEVMLAEATGLPFAKAVQSPKYLRMQQVHFGLQNALQWQLTQSMQDVMRTLLAHGASGGFDDLRALVFSIATREHSADAALCRFFLWTGMRLNLLVLTWGAPEIEALGALDEMDLRAQPVLRELLNVPELFRQDMRPLHVLVAEMFKHLSISVKHRLRKAVREYGTQFEQILTNAHALALVRCLDAKDAVLFAPGRFAGPPGSAQIALRYPQHFASANALEQYRSRTRRRTPANEKTRESVAMIDVMRESIEAAR